MALALSFATAMGAWNALRPNADPTNQAIMAEARGLLRSGGWAPRAPQREALRHFYDSASAPLWVRAGALNERGTTFLSTLPDIQAEGLRPEEYRDQRVEEALAELSDSAGVGATARAELELSDAFIRVAEALGNGRSDPRDAGLTWDIAPDSISHETLLEDLASGDSPGEVLDDLRPELPMYEQMREALEAYRAVEGAGGWPRVPTDVGGAVEPGDTSVVVAAVRTRLGKGMDPELARLSARGGDPNVFDEDLVEAVGRFQERHGIRVDSVLGPATLKAMDVTAAARARQLELNLDRIRRLPRTLGERAILVNVAGFELAVLERGEPAIRMDVVVGQPEWRTAIFDGLMEYVVVNPYWQVPQSIAAEEILPALAENPGYVEERHLVLVEESDPFGEPVPLEGMDIDWEEVDTASFPYRFRQEPGPSNALGRVKFMFPNGYQIYLHDTPADELFQKDMRALSHGCIRLGAPMRLARYVLENASDVDPDTLDALLEEGERTRLDLVDPIPVYVVYLTAWVGPAEEVRFQADIYGRDRALEASSRE